MRSLYQKSTVLLGLPAHGLFAHGVVLVTFIRRQDTPSKPISRPPGAICRVLLQELHERHSTPDVAPKPGGSSGTLSLWMPAPP